MTEMKNDTIGKIAEEIKKTDGLIHIIPHMQLDGDAIGSSAALCRGLSKMGKKADILLEDRIPDNLTFLAGGMCVYERDDPHDAEMCICVDCSDMGRFPKRKKWFDAAEKTICIDHHKAEEGIADFNHIDHTAAACAELIYDLMLELGCGFDEEQAIAIYAGIATDTGNFMYSNTTAKSHEIAAEMMKTGMDSNVVNVGIYESESFEKLKLHARVLENAKIFAGGLGIAGTISQKDLKETGTKMADTEGIVAQLRSISGIEIAVLIKEQQSGVIKVSMRAKEWADVQKICAAHNGGGHVRASGCTLYDTLENAEAVIIADAEKELMRHDGNN